MGNLIINKVKYSGDNYFFESPELTPGVNLIVGDNGSGKSTFSYFIEYGLGGSIKYFSISNKIDQYKIISEDKNNFIELEITINNERYGLKRFLNHNDIFIKQNNSVEKLPVFRSKDVNFIFSDWLLNKLGIDVFELNFGASTWQFNFNDLFRLLHYDQDTEPRKIFKSPNYENFISDSVTIRKAIFETLIGVSSNEYYRKFNELKSAFRNKEELNSLLQRFQNIYPALSGDSNSIVFNIGELKTQLDKLYKSRDLYQKKNTNVGDKLENIEEIQASFIEIELLISETTIHRRNFEIERDKIEKIKRNIEEEIAQIQKVIFTHEKLNLFSLEMCPFCMEKIQRDEGVCICGTQIQDNNYEKFLYNSSEYKDILKHKEKSIETISLAFNSYNNEVISLEKKIEDMKREADSLKEKLSLVIKSIEFSGNSQLIDRLNDKILAVKESILKNQELLNLLLEKSELESQVENAVATLKTIKEEFQETEKEYLKNNKKTIEEFNAIYNQLMSKSSSKTDSAIIDEDYLPLIDQGIYREKSASVPKRLMYYLAAFSLSLKFDSVNHPKFLLIDTPETGGIDTNNLKENLELINLAIQLGKVNLEVHLEDFQIILTTGIDKYPDSFKNFVKINFNKADNNYILKKKQA